MSVLRLVDALIGVGIFFLALYVSGNQPEHSRETAFILFLMTLLVLHTSGLYRSWRFSAFEEEISYVLSGCVALYFFLFLLAFILRATGEFMRGAVFAWMAAWPLALAALRVLVRTVLRHYRARGHNVRSAIIVGNGQTGEQLARLIDANPWSGTKLVGFFDDTRREPLHGCPRLGDLSALTAFVRERHIDIVYLTLPQHEEGKIRFILEALADTTASVHFIPDVFFLDLIFGGNLTFFDYVPVITLRDFNTRGLSSAVKRAEDYVLASLCILMLSPLFLVIPLLIRLTSRGPVLFRQWRYGLNGQQIEIYKFRTMTVCEDGYVFRQAQKNDSRITPLGAFLRRTSLDEIPQFLNVLQGRMSVVGPRPHPVAMNEQYRRLVPGYMLRHTVKPGITGLAQIHGLRGETDTIEKISARVRYDLDYVKHWSPLLDVKIIVKTVLSGAWHAGA